MEIDFKIFTSIITIFTIVACGCGNSNNQKKSFFSDPDNQALKQTVEIGEILTTDIFEIITKKIEIFDSIKTSAPNSNLIYDKGIKYITIDAEFKNIDKENQIPSEGNIWIYDKSVIYVIDEIEEIKYEGKELPTEQIKPQTQKRIKLVYSIPAEINGTAYWIPEKRNFDLRIHLGELSDLKNNF